MRTLQQLSRYAVVGVASNVLLYLLYLLLTWGGMGHKLAATLAYALGVGQTFVFNRRWSFGHTGVAAVALGRYVAAYGLGYVTNILALHLLVDRGGLPHQWVQGAMILVIAGLLFVLQKTWVFRH